MDWTVGDVKVTRVREAMSSVPFDLMYPGADPAILTRNADWLAPYLDEDGALLFAVQAFVIDTGRHVILVDTCLGEHDSDEARTSTVIAPFLPTLAEAGYALDDIDFVLCTHFHNDHVGWNTRQVDGTWVPTFPKARYLFGRIEYEHTDSTERRSVSGFNPLATFEDAVGPVMAAGLADLVETDHRICDEVWLEPAPGHTPGQVSVHIASKGAEALVTGDSVHHPVQLAQPDFRMFLDHDPDLAIRTRRALFERAAERGARVFGTHFPGDSAGFVERAEERTYRFRQTADG